VQLCLGTVYAWSYFQKLLVDKPYGWSNAQVAGTFSSAICCLGLAAAWGGLNLPRFGPRRLTMIGGALFGAGHLLAALALYEKSLLLLYLGYGVIGGAGLGLAYVTPVATVAKWFPDKKGLMTGMVIMGFGFGALLMSKVFAPLLFHACGGNLVAVFAWLGIGFLPTVVALGAVLRNPPPGFAPSREHGTGSRESPSLLPAPCSPLPSPGLLSRQFAVMWLVFFVNIVAGISLISFQSPLFQNLLHGRDPHLTSEVLAAYGATLIAASSLFNGIGRITWGGISDYIGRVRTFQLMLASQIVAFALLTQAGNPWLFGGLICYILLCYGGGFGTMPSFVLDEFGPVKMPMVYGAILTAWSAGGIVGPQLVAFLNDHYANHVARYVFLGNAAVLLLGLALTGLLGRPERR